MTNSAACHKYTGEVHIAFVYTVVTVYSIPAHGYVVEGKPVMALLYRIPAFLELGTALRVTNSYT
jgi:hypothetical protein